MKRKRDNHRKEIDDAVLRGVLIALGCVYVCDAEQAAEEIVESVGANALLRVAQREEDCYLPHLRNTIRFVKSK